MAMKRGTLFSHGFRGEGDDHSHGRDSSSASESVPDIEVIEEPAAKRGKAPTPKPVKTGVKAKRTWRTNWEREFPWLKRNQVGGRDHAQCTWCIEAGKNNSFSGNGSANIQHSAFSRHETRNPEHLMAAAGKRSASRGHTVKKQWTAAEKREPIPQSKLSQMRTLYYITKQGLPINQQNNMLVLQKLNGCQHLQDEEKWYTSAESHDDMFASINQVIEDEVDAKILNSPFIGVILDETTDVSINKKLNLYVRTVENGRPVVHFFSNVKIPDGKAETITNQLFTQCAAKGLDFAKIISMASDGASVMLGNTTGVGVRFKNANPRLIHIHCVAHRLALAAAQACKDVESFQVYQADVKSVYKFFSDSPVRYETLRSVYEVLEDDELDTKFITLKEPASFRWLSLHAAVTAVFNCYPALVTALEHEAAKPGVAGAGNQKAQGILDKVKSCKFAYLTTFFVDVLPTLSKLSKFFQGETVSICGVRPMVTSTTNRLNDFKDEDGVELSRFIESVDDQDGKYKGIKLTYVNLMPSCKRASESYIDKVVENIEQRFDPESMDILIDLDKVLNPVHLRGLPAADIRDYGKDSIIEIQGRFGHVVNAQLSVNADGELTEEEKELPPLIDSKRLGQDYPQFKYMLKSFGHMSLLNMCEHIILHLADEFPDLCTLAQITMASPITSVACERGFSAQNRVKTKSRSRLKEQKVDRLVRVIQEGPPLVDYDPIEATRHFTMQKNRRK